MSAATKIAPSLAPLPTKDSVPEELLELPRWVCWQALWDERKGKWWKKPPFSPLDGTAIDSLPKHSSHWTTFEQALTGCGRFGFDGIGFVFSAEDGFFGVDWDNCRDPVTREVHPEVRKWLERFPSYSEVSPGGTGIHSMCRGKLKRGLNSTPLTKDNNGPKAAVYHVERYFTFTGQRVSLANTVTDCRIGVEELLVALDETTRLDLTCKAIRLCRRQGMPLSSRQRILREVIRSVWEPQGSRDKRAHYRSKNAIGLRFGKRQLIYDHAIPFLYCQEALLALRDLSPESVKDTLEKYSTRVIITTAEDLRLTVAGLQRKMPNDWDGRDPLARYKAVGIELIENNH